MSFASVLKWQLEDKYYEVSKSLQYSEKHADNVLVPLSYRKGWRESGKGEWERNERKNVRGGNFAF